MTAPEPRTVGQLRAAGHEPKRLRQEIRDNLLERLRSGEDPWDFMSELPSVDEIVVLLLRSERILPPHAVRPGHDVSDHVLRRIVDDYPPLAPTVWSMLEPAEPERAWAPRVRRDAA